MLISDLLKETQPRTFAKLQKIKTVNENLTTNDFERLMSHSSYRRGRGGIRQVR